MSTELASNHADSIAADIHWMTDAGTPFGIIHEMEGWADIDGDEYADWRDNEDTEWREATALDYLDDVLDTEYRVGSDGVYRSAKILIGFGGPNVWIDTGTGQLEVTWWSAPEFRELPDSFIEGLDEVLEELWNCR